VQGRELVDTFPMAERERIANHDYSLDPAQVGGGHRPLDVIRAPDLQVVELDLQYPGGSR